MRLPILIALTTVLAGCESNDECDAQRACTMEYRFITIEVRYSLLNPYVLDSTVTFIAKTGEVLPIEEQSWQDGVYTAFTDSHMEYTNTVGESFTFRGYKGGEQKVSEALLIRHDCCHIELVAGNTFVMVTDLRHYLPSQPSALKLFTPLAKCRHTMELASTPLTLGYAPDLLDKVLRIRP